MSGKKKINKFTAGKPLKINKKNADKFIEVIGGPLVEAIKANGDLDKLFKAYEVRRVNAKSGTVTISAVKKRKTKA